MFGKDNKPNPVDDDFKMLDQEISQLTNQGDEAGDISSVSDKPALPPKSPPSLQSGKAFDIINRPSTPANPAEAKEAEAAVQEAYEEDTKNHESIINGIRSHRGSKFISQDEDGNEIDPSDGANNSVALEDPRDKTAESIPAPNSYSSSATELSNEAKAPDLNSNIKYQTSENSSNETFSEAEAPADSLPASETTTDSQDQNEILTSGENAPNVHGSVNNHLASKETENSEISVFDTKEYHAPLHDWSNVNTASKSKAPLFILLAFMLAAGLLAAGYLFFVKD